MRVREALPGEREGALTVLDAAMLETGSVPESTLLVAVEDGPVLGVLALSGERIEAIAVRRRRRGQGIGTALVEAASERRGRLVAEFDEGVRPFYESRGFDVEPVDEGRLRGVRTRPA